MVCVSCSLIHLCSKVVDEILHCGEQVTLEVGTEQKVCSDESNLFEVIIKINLLYC
jgi:hypothetical protein